MFSTNFNWSIFEYFVLYFEQKKQFLFQIIDLKKLSHYIICNFLMNFFKIVALIAFVTEVLCSLIQLEQREKIVSDIFCTIDPNFYSFQICYICFRILINKEKHRQKMCKKQNPCKINSAYMRRMGNFKKTYSKCLVNLATVAVHFSFINVPNFYVSSLNFLFFLLLLSVSNSLRNMVYSKF